jgi:pyruvate/2-oxoglutarate dehydrogenase complex dihydrolipoamide acyltransferase (E2) component
VTIETADGYSVTLTHLGTIAVAKGATVAEEQAVGTIGPSGTPEVDGPYVHLGIRLSADPNGYVDPLSLLPPVPASSTTESGSTGAQPSSSSAASAPPATKPASSAPRGPRVANARGSRTEPVRSRTRVHRQERAQKPRARARSTRSQHRSVVRDRASEPTASSFRRPVAEPTVPRQIGLDAGHEPRPSAHVAQPHPDPSNLFCDLTCNGAAAVFALALVIAASRRRRRLNASPIARAKVLHLSPLADEHRHASRAA